MENRKIKWGILGTGRIARVFAKAIQVVENAELHAVGSRSIENAQKFASEFNIPTFHGSYEELVQNPEVEVIYIATPHNLHLENTLLVLNQGKHVLCEKPLGVNEKEVRLMLEKASEKNLFLMEALWSRFLPHIIKTKQLIDSGVIGVLKSMNVSFCFKSTGDPEHRHFNIDLCGGTVLDIGIYNIFLSLFLFGKPQQISAIAKLNNQGCDTESTYMFEYLNNKQTQLHSSFIIDAPIVAEIIGTKGKIKLEHRWFCTRKTKLILENGTEQIFDFEIKSNGYEYEVIEVTNCILQGKTQSELWSWNNSLELVKIMDEIRKQCGIFYPNHDK